MHLWKSRLHVDSRPVTLSPVTEIEHSVSSELKRDADCIVWVQPKGVFGQPAEDTLFFLPLLYPQLCPFLSYSIFLQRMKIDQLQNRSILPRLSESQDLVNHKILESVYIESGSYFHTTLGHSIGILYPTLALNPEMILCYPRRLGFKPFQREIHAQLKPTGATTSLPNRRQKFMQVHENGSSRTPFLLQNL